MRAGDGGAAHALLRELEERARPDTDLGALAMTYVAEVDSTLREVVERAGYELVRHSFRMEIPLDGELHPRWPEGIRIRTYDAEQEVAVYEAHQESFADHWEHKRKPVEEWRKWLVQNPAFDPSFWFVACDGDEIAGISLCRVHASGDLRTDSSACSPFAGRGGDAAWGPPSSSTRSST